ncbi:MAG: tripartite tricarboxylate transporter permease [Deltaproteobacteria bacterium]|nr:tripartite tricarboxylate transporter permease [Deltaproteobacteria bacterium]
MDFFNNLSMAFQIASTPMNLLVCFIGVFIGTLTGVLPGIGSTAAMSLLLPATFTLSPVQSIIMLAGIYYGAMYGGSTTSILLNVPGEGTSMITCLDGYPMAKNGRAGPALGIAAFGSFIAGTFAIVMLMILGPFLANVALEFGPPENVALTFLGLTLVTYLGSGSWFKSLMMAAFGLLLGCIGLDLVKGTERYTFHILQLREGVGLIPIMMGLFGVAEVLLTIETSFKKREFFKTSTKELLPSKQDWKDSKGPIFRGTVVGFFLGIIPGGGGLLASLMSYAMEKRVSKHPEKFGTGTIEGVAGPETANNAGAGGSFIPLLTLGIPCNVVMALLMGALMIHGITPGPLLLKEQPSLFWGVVGSMYIGNVMLLALNLPLIGIWVKILKIPYTILFPIIFLLCVIGSYSLNNSTWDVGIMIVFGVLGYLMKKFGYEGAPLIMALVLGPMFEVAFRQSLVISNGSPLIFFTRPISAVFTVIAILILLSPIALRMLRKARPGLLKGDEEF